MLHRDFYIGFLFCIRWFFMFYIEIIAQSFYTKTSEDLLSVSIDLSTLSTWSKELPCINIVGQGRSEIHSTNKKIEIQKLRPDAALAQTQQPQYIWDCGATPKHVKPTAPNALGPLDLTGSNFPQNTIL